MKKETLQKALKLEKEIHHYEYFLKALATGDVVEINFYNRCTCSHSCELLEEEELAAIKDNLVELLRNRAELKLSELKEQFENL